ncbi:MAG: hypothetical protein ACLFRX_03490 [Gemmatimonadota bacterium]
MSRTGLITTVVLGTVVVLITLALFREAASGPTFRAEDYGSYQECMGNIPAEWGPGSLHRGGAEDACHYVHRRMPAR